MIPKAKLKRVWYKNLSNKVLCSFNIVLGGFHRRNAKMHFLNELSSQ